MRTLTYRLFHISKKIALLSFFLVVLIIVFARLVTPTLLQHEKDLSQWLSEQIDRPLEIGHVNIYWDYGRPVVDISNIEIKEPHTFRPLLKAKHLRIHIDILSSLLHRELRHGSWKFKNVSFALSQTKDKKWYIPGLTTTQDTQDNLKPLQRVTNLIYAQRRITFSDTAIHFTRYDGKTFFLKLPKVSLNNESTESKINGRLLIDPKSKLKINFHIASNRHIFQSRAKEARFFVKVKNLTPSDSLITDHFKTLGVSMRHANFQLWGTWRNQHLTTLQADIDATDTHFTHGLDTTVVYPKIKGHLGWLTDHQGQWHLYGQGLSINTGTHLWPNTHFEVQKSYLQSDQAQYLIRANYGQIEDVLHLISKVKGKPTKLLDTLQHLHPKGAFKNLIARVSFPLTGSDSAVSLTLDQYSQSAWQKIPGIKNLSGKLRWHGALGSFIFDSKNTTLLSQAVFAKPFEVTQLTGELQWRIRKDDIALQTKDLAIQKESVKANTQFSFHQQGDAPAHIGALVGIEEAKMHDLRTILPDQLLHGHANEWLYHAFDKGTLTSATLLINGPAQHFPYEHHEGTYQFIAHVKDASLLYEKDWPTIEHLTATVAGTDRSLYVKATDGDFYGAKLATTDASIRDMGHTKKVHLSVQGHVLGALEQGVRYLKDSPLKDGVGEELHQLSLKGPMDLDLGLEIPLGTQAHTTTVKGAVTTENASILIPKLKLPITQIDSTLAFTEKSLSSEKFSASVLGQLAKGHIDTQTKKGKHLVDVIYDVPLELNEVTSFFTLPLLKHLSGNTQANGKFSFSLDHDSPARFMLQTDMTGVTVALPKPFAKPTSQKKSFILTYVLPTQKAPLGPLTFTYNKNVSAIFTHLFDPKQHVTGQVHIGKAFATLPKQPGVEIVGHVNNLNFNTWQDFLDTNHNDFGSSVLSRLDITAQSLSLEDMIFNNTRFILTPKRPGFLVNLSGPSVRGNAIINLQKQLPELSLDLKYLYLNHLPSHATSDQGLSTLKQARITFNCEDLRINDWFLGHTLVQALPGKTGINLSQVLIRNPVYTLKATGSWQQQAKHHSSHLEGSLNTANFGRLLNIIGKANAIHNAKGSIGFDLSWPDSLPGFKLEKSTGNINVKLKDGQIIGVNPGIGRLLSLLSIENIARRLKLDFSDVTKEGFTFDRLTGDFQLSGQRAHIKKLLIEGPTADATLEGNVLLKQRALDLGLTVYPNITASLPLAAAIAAGNPVIGVAVWMVDKVISPQIQEISHINYTVTGPWSKPEVKDVPKGR